MTPTIAEVVVAADLGKPAARKKGRNPRYPHVPVITHGRYTKQLLGKAFADRGDAIQYAADYIARQRAELAAQLAEPRYRALREHYGLPRDLTPTTTEGAPTAP